jgi:hypothetical protein
MKCNLWDKTNDIKMMLETIDLSNASVYDSYEKYCKMQQRENKMIVTKYFFEKYMYELFGL